MRKIFVVGFLIFSIFVQDTWLQLRRLLLLVPLFTRLLRLWRCRRRNCTFSTFPFRVFIYHDHITYCIPLSLIPSHSVNVLTDFKYLHIFQTFCHNPTNRTRLKGVETLEFAAVNSPAAMCNPAYQYSTHTHTGCTLYLCAHLAIDHECKRACEISFSFLRL